MRIETCFDFANSFIGEVYFRVSKHLGCFVSEVIKNKFHPDYKFLIIKYSAILRAEIEQAEKEEKEANKLKNKR